MLLLLLLLLLLHRAARPRPRARLGCKRPLQVRCSPAPSSMACSAGWTFMFEPSVSYVCLLLLVLVVSAYLHVSMTRKKNKLLRTTCAWDQSRGGRRAGGRVSQMGNATDTSREIRGLWIINARTDPCCRPGIAKKNALLSLKF
jgi:hypothetical protein